MYTEGPPAFKAASAAVDSDGFTWAFPWILSGAVSVFLDSLADGPLEQPPNPARVSTRKQKTYALRYISVPSLSGCFRPNPKVSRGIIADNRSAAHSFPRLLRRKRPAGSDDVDHSRRKFEG